MDYQAYLTWLNEIDDLSPEQRLETGRLLAGQPSLEAVIDLLEARVRTMRACPHCTVGGMVIRGRANGLSRYYCKSCGKTSNALKHFGVFNKALCFFFLFSSNGVRAKFVYRLWC